MNHNHKLIGITAGCLSLLAGAAVFHACINAYAADNREPVDYVNPYIGNISHLLVPTFPTVQLPNSMLRVYPEPTIPAGCSTDFL